MINKKDIGLLDKFLKSSLKRKNMNQINYRVFPLKVDDSNSNYTMEEFLILYKLNRLNELGIINDKISNNLREIFDIKIKVDQMIQEELKKEVYSSSYVSKFLPSLNEQADIISKHFKKYNLSFDNESISDIMDMIIEKENNVKIISNKVKIKKLD